MDVDADVDAVADELYGLVPARFTEVRDERAAKARKDGQAQAARAIAGLRRPTRAAFASNLLVRRRPKEVAAFLELGAALRRAHRSLDGTQLKDLSHQRHVVVAALARTARQLAEEEGQAVSESVAHEVEQTLHAALADPDAAEQWSSGRLATALTPPVGFTGLPAMAPVRPQPAVTRTEAPPKPKPKPKPTPQPSRAAEQRRARHEQARRKAEETGAEATAREAELREAERGQRDHEQALAEADARVAELERQLRGARTGRTEARRALAEATGRVRDAARAAGAARHNADAAADRLAELPGAQE
ncbi:hypothetical protein [Streptomyces sp. A1547]|uniref:hypothetical protein n=1 Tax=Streptomyces sp. A1547 TaxID=2563105 RepID=UPI00109E5EE5|nr:hypothetical protein [Streptomyces sp. A1547]THA31202.1 hypothetical protein E6W17_36130 [Streptomyces sp. A1547]